MVLAVEDLDFIVWRKSLSSSVSYEEGLTFVRVDDYLSLDAPFQYLNCNSSVKGTASDGGVIYELYQQDGLGTNTFAVYMLNSSGKSTAP